MQDFIKAKGKKKKETKLDLCFWNLKVKKYSKQLENIWKNISTLHHAFFFLK